ncbi:MAG TPA: tetratricopeptide repeat protein [Candidatus Angelobacter sp.]|nr:tetratricopeptide repeat protein [Candidatus Angelobacter sp.]
MYELSVENAVSEIAQACEGRLGKQSPFFFIVGAGISAPTIPLASEIESECKAIAAKYNRSIEPKSKNAIDSYSHWFELAFPNAEQRQKYLREKIQGKLISPAVFRLAHLLLSKAAGNIVITPNFDDFLSRALILFGEQHVICDHPSTVSRVSIEANDVQIVHVHGTYWFYDCCNLKAEITQRADPSGSGPVTITSFLEHLLWSRSPIVLGYSGWEGDVIMSALQRRLQSPMPFNLYWFCYKYSDSESLPAWIRENPRVRMVRPPAAAPISSGRSDEDKLEAAAPKGLDDKGFDPTTLSARSVLDLLVTTFKLEAPQLTKDPLQFFASQLGKSIFTGEDETGGVDFYSFQSVLGRVQTAAKLFQNTERAQSKIESLLEEIRDAVRRSDYCNAIQAAKTVSIIHATPNQLEELINLTMTAAEGLGYSNTDGLEGYQVVLSSAEFLSGQSKLNTAVTAKWARALHLKGFLLGKSGHIEDAIVAIDEVVRRFGEASELALRVQVAKALYNKGVGLRILNRSEDAIAAYDEVVQRFGDASELALREQVAMALYNKGWGLGHIDRSEDALAAYDEVVQRFGDASELALREQVAKALYNKGWSLGQLNRNEDAIAAYDELVRRFGDASELALREPVAKTLFNKGIELEQLNRNKDAIAAYEEVVRRFRGATEVPLLEFAAKALLAQAKLFKELNQKERMLSICSEILQNFENRSEAELQVYVQEAKKLMDEGNTEASSSAATS